MEKIIFNKRVINYLNDTVCILHSKNYFSFIENAIEYKDTILNEITVQNLKRYRVSKTEYQQLGSFYIKVKSNYRTTWYVFFDKVNNTYYIEHIINNHLPEAKYLNQ